MAVIVELTLWYLIITLSFLLLNIYCLHSVIDIMYYTRTCNSKQCKITQGILAIVFILTVGLMNVIVLRVLVILLGESA